MHVCLFIFWWWCQSMPQCICCNALKCIATSVFSWIRANVNARIIPLHQNRAYRPVKMAAMFGHCSMVKHLLQVYHCDLHAKNGVSSAVIFGTAEKKWSALSRFAFVCMWSVWYKCAVGLRSASWCCVWRKCGAGEVVGGRKRPGCAWVEQGILQPKYLSCIRI